MKLVLARYFELRAGMRFPKIGTPEWRLKWALRRIQKHTPAKRKTLHNLNREYVELKRQGGDPERLRKLEVLIRALDGDIVMEQRGAAPIVALIYFHFRLGYSSPQTAAELAIMPQTVRKIAMRLTHLWEKMQSDQDRKPTKKEIKNAKVREHRKNFTPEQREAFKKYHADYWKTNKEIMRANIQHWREANPELVRKHSGEAHARWTKKKMRNGESPKESCCVEPSSP
jgi:hypothetical protein